MPKLNHRAVAEGRATVPARAIPVEWRGLARSAAVEALIRSEATRLEAFASKPVVWKVRIHAPQHPHSLQDGICVSIEVRAPERQVIVARADPEAGTALREAFAALFRTFDRRLVVDRRTFVLPEEAGESQVANRRASRYSMLAA